MQTFDVFLVNSFMLMGGFHFYSVMVWLLSVTVRFIMDAVVLSLYGTVTYTMVPVGY